MDLSTDQASQPAAGMVSHLVILGHPSTESFNATLAEAYMATVRSKGQHAILRDLYAIDFDPLLKEAERTASGPTMVPDDARHELELATQSDVVVFVYPLWFGAPPAIIKGYLDRVFGAATRYVDFTNPKKSPFAGKRLAVISTSGSSLPWLEGQGIWISLRQSFDQYLKAVVGFSRCDHYHADGIVDGLGPSHAARVIYEVTDFANKICSTSAHAAARD
jgi:NAD(P)H dehydrogenase (quinone)